MLPNSLFPRSPSTRRLLFLFLILITVSIIVYAVAKATLYTVNFYSLGTFIQYHMDMTPAFMANDVPVKNIPTQELGYTAVVIYLIGASRIRDLMLSLSYLYQNVPMHPWPIVLFYTDDMRDHSARTEFMLRLYDFLGGGQDVRNFLTRIEFERLEWSLPHGISPNKGYVDPVFIHAWPGYHFMINFFALQIFDHPRLRDATYYLRLDTDSYIYKPLCYDPLEIFHARNRTYGFRSQASDPAWLTQGMWAFADEFARARPQVEETLGRNGWQWPKNKKKMDEEPFPTYYNNFEIVKLETFRRPDIREWLDAVRRDPKHIFKYRWGDAAIRFATVNMYLNVSKDVEEYCGMQYWHNGVQGEHCSCEDQKRGR